MGLRSVVGYFSCLPKAYSLGSLVEHLVTLEGIERPKWVSATAERKREGLCEWSLWTRHIPRRR